MSVGLPLDVSLARIGPNAIVQTRRALIALEGEGRTRALLGTAGLAPYVDHPPQEMVPEGEVNALMACVHRTLDPTIARAVRLIAGQTTGDYLLANRIPGAAQALLKHLPPRLASRALLSAIARHTWTFAGSAQVTIEPGPPVAIRVHDCPLCRGLDAAEPCCQYYAATFERLYRTLVHHAATARETACRAAKAPACVFEIEWPR